MGVDWQFKDNYNYAPNGRIWIVWKEANVHVTVLESTDQLLRTFVYDLHTVQHIIPQRRSLNMQTNGPWLIIGDFNSVLTVDDRVNGIQVHQTEMIEFQNCDDDIGVGQITKRGSRFSWSSKRDSEVRIYSHIDWAFGNVDWFNAYNGVEAIYMLPGSSDHTLIMINTEAVKVKVKKPYRLLTSVMQQREYKEIVQNTWNQQIQGYAMYSWKLNDDYFNKFLIEEERKTLESIEKWEAIQEQIMRQKSRATWIQLGDDNTRYFHAYMRARQARNKVSCICNEQQMKITEPKHIQKEFIQFFQPLLGTTADELPGIDVNVARKGPCLRLNQLQQLL
ncbi:PREDICTED: uncharacterized protein LOC109233537 [Nicotiana attenuata]|uniref:uncharacterized protein LOC109233537 n=1 Tax=Nicotiana attenuata TaxID=49451 RepID=UPI0009050DB1|nr:PREDICTED: uncharacterized protein LOC109233537 [Nicotiana attenuata]